MNLPNSTYGSYAPNNTYCVVFDISSFSGKERDAETGYSYFDARYYDAELTTTWLSVDPMADKYPGISPYAYCAWNPVKLVDPDGNIIKAYDKATRRMVSTYMFELLGKSNLFRFDKSGNLTIQQRHYEQFLQTATSDQKQLLEGFKAAINTKKVA